MRYLRPLRITLITLAMLATGCAFAGDYEDGVYAYKVGDYSTAATKWRPLADRGDARAANNMGVLHEKGWGVTLDYDIAADWYRVAASAGNAMAGKNLADLRARGLIADSAADDALIAGTGTPNPPPEPQHSTTLSVPKPENCFWKGGADRAACDCRNTGYVQGTAGFDQCFALMIQKQAADDARLQEGLANAARILQTMEPPPPVRMQTNCTTIRVGNTLQTHCW